MSCVVVTVDAAKSDNSHVQPEILSSVDGKLDVTLTVDIGTTINGKRTSAIFNNKPMGPTLRVKPGDTLTVTLQNNLPTSTPLDRELYNYIQDEQNEINDPINMTIIYNRLDDIGNLYNPKYGFWGMNYINLHFHGKKSHVYSTLCCIWFMCLCVCVFPL